MFGRMRWPMLFLVPMVLAGAGCASSSASTSTQLSPDQGGAISVQDQQRLIDMTQQLLDATSRGDTAVWNRYLADGAILTDADGRTRTKTEWLGMIQPFPAGYSGTITLEHPVVRSYGSVAVINYEALQREMVYGQPITLRYHTTDMYMKTAGAWRMIASQAVILPAERIPVVVDSTTLSAYVGRYALAPEVVYEVTQEGRHLFGHWPGQPNEELLPLDSSTFFRRGERGERIFMRDSAGHVISMVDRRDNNDLVLTKLPDHR